MAQSIAIVSGNGQVTCSSCPTRAFSFDPLVVIVRGASGNPVANATVIWTLNVVRGVDARITSNTTTTGADGTSSNYLLMSSPLTLLTPYVQASVTASTAGGGSVIFYETDGSAASGTGIAQISSSLISPIPGTTFSGAAGSASSTPVKVAVSSFSPGGPVSGVEVRVVSDPTYPATASCGNVTAGEPNSVLTDQSGTATCNLQFGSTTGLGRIKIYVGGNYDVYGPYGINVTTGSGNPNPGGGGGNTSPGGLSTNPSSLTFQYPGAVTQTVSVSSSSGSVIYTTAVQSTIVAINWLSVSAPSGPAASGAASSFQVTLLPQSLQPGTYQANVVVHPTNGSGDLAIPVQVTVQSGGAPAPAQLTASPAALTFQYPGPASQTMSVSSTGGSVIYTASVQVSIAAISWLTLGAPSGPATSGAPSTFQVTLNPQGMAPGMYQATIAIHPTNGTQDLAIPVTVSIQQAATVVAVSPTSLNLTQTAGTPPFSGGAISVVNSTGPAVAFNAVASGGSWLSISPGSGNTPGQLAVSINGGNLQPGTYTGVVSITATGATNSQMSVPVSLTVKAAQNLRPSTSALSFTSQMDAGAPAAQTVTLAVSDGSLAYSTIVSVLSPLGGNWLAVNPPSGVLGTGPSTLTVGVNPAGLSPGTYSAMISFVSASAANSPQAVNVTYVVTPIPAPAPSTVTNAASGFSGPIAPGEIISIQGSNLGPATGVQTDIKNGFVESVLSDTQVIFDNIASPLMFVSANAITAIVPYEVAGRASVQMVVTYKGIASAPIPVSVANTAPGVYMDATGQASVLNEDGTPNSPSNPAQKGHAILIYGTGEGATDPYGTDGLVIPTDGSRNATPLLPVTITIGGSMATLQSAGSVPGKVSGAFQASVIVPDDAPSGSAVWLLLTVGTVNAPTAFVAIQ